MKFATIEYSYWIVAIMSRKVEDATVAYSSFFAYAAKKALNKHSIFLLSIYKRETSNDFCCILLYQYLSLGPPTA